MFHYKNIGLNNIYLKDGYKIHTFGNDQGVSFYDAMNLFDLIGFCIATKEGRLAPNEFKYLRVLLDLPLNITPQLFGTNQRFFVEMENGKAPIGEDQESRMRNYYLDFCSLHSFSPIKKSIRTADFDEVNLVLEHSKEQRQWRIRYST
jgi:hypothetical protein